MKVYLVYAYCCDGESHGQKNLKMFTTREKAETYIHNFKGIEGDLWITPEELNEYIQKYSEEIEALKHEAYENRDVYYKDHTYEEFTVGEDNWLDDEGYLRNVLKKKGIQLFTAEEEKPYQYGPDPIIREVKTDEIGTYNDYVWWDFYIHEAEVE